MAGLGRQTWLGLPSQASRGPVPRGGEGLTAPRSGYITLLPASPRLQTNEGVTQWPRQEQVCSRHREAGQEVQVER